MEKILKLRYTKYICIIKETNRMNSSNIGHIETYLDQNDAPSPTNPNCTDIKLDGSQKVVDINTVSSVI